MKSEKRRSSFKDQSPAAYNDVKFVMDLALQKPDLRYECSTYGKAVHFKVRCNKFRNLMRAMAQEQVEGIPGYRAQVAYDILVISQVDDDGNPCKTGRHLIFRHVAPMGKIIDPETEKEIEMKLDIPLIDGIEE